MFHIITKDDCRYCKLAKSAIDARGLPFTEEVLTPEKFATFKATGFATVPQIWTVKDGELAKHIGGFTDLMHYFDQHFPE